VLFFLTLERLGILGKKRPPEESASMEEEHSDE